MTTSCRALVSLAVLGGLLLTAAPSAHAVTCGTASNAVAQTAGPYYTPGPPSRRDIAPAGTVGTPLILRGRVLDSSCTPVAGAKVDFWQADGRGVYDNVGYRLRGYQRTDAQGRYRLVTVIPGQYPGRTEHIHVKITPPGGATFTTQLYFPGSPHNDTDGIFSPAMVLRVTTDTPALMRARYAFVLPL
jgi:protocatechuate 3,4-dioxygenase beta subunit